MVPRRAQHPPPIVRRRAPACAGPRAREPGRGPRPRYSGAVQARALLALAFLASAPLAGTRAALVLDGARVLAPDGASWRDGLALLVRDGRIAKIAARGELEVPSGAPVVDLSGLYLIPGSIDLHSHLLLHPYDEAPWEDQVLEESLELRTIRGVLAARPRRARAGRGGRGLDQGVRRPAAARRQSSGQRALKTS